MNRKEFCQKVRETAYKVPPDEWRPLGIAMVGTKARDIQAERNQSDVNPKDGGCLVERVLELDTDGNNFWAQVHDKLFTPDFPSAGIFTSLEPLMIASDNQDLEAVLLALDELENAQ